MADFKIDVVVSDGNTTRKITTNVDQLGAAVDKTNRKVRSSKKEHDDLFDTQKKGIIGTANSTRSFSKLAETLGNGGSSGLVGAYATLAANIFAVSAAFNALRGASQVEQVMKGLEAAGVRAGLSLTGTAKGLQEVTGNAISAEQAMRSTAQIAAAGFDDKTIKKIGSAARDVSFALGRNMTDSLDRLTRGMVKLEPELLDELGVFTKLTESNNKYAAELGKSANALTGYEKRVGFTNAVLAELDLKFGGLADSAGNTVVYDQLAATFTNLTNSIFNFANIIAKPILSVLSSSMVSLLGVMVLFGSTLKGQLVPALANAAINSLKAAKLYKEEAAAKLENVSATKKAASAEALANIQSKSSLLTLDKIPGKYAAVREAIKSGTLSIEEQNKAINTGVKSIEKSITMHQRQLDNNINYADTPATSGARAAKQASIVALESEKKALEELKAASNEAANTDLSNNEVVKRARQDSIKATHMAASAEHSAASLGAASTLKLGESFKELKLSVNSYRAAQLVAGTEGSAAMLNLRVAAFAAAGGAKALGAAFLTVLPYIGLITLALGLMKSAYEALKSDELKKYESAIEVLEEVTKNANAQFVELLRISNSQASASSRAAAAITLQSNAVREAATKFKEFNDAAKAYETGSFFDMFTGDSEQSDKVAAWYEWTGNKAALSFQLGLKKNSKALNLAEALNGTFTGLSTRDKAAIELFNTLEQTNSTAFKSFMKSKGGADAFIASLVKLTESQRADELEKLATSISDSGADIVKSFQEAQKQLDTTIGTFARASIISTPFDDLIKDGDALTDTLTGLKNVSTSKELSQLLSGYDDNNQLLLTKETVREISEYKKSDQIVQADLVKGTKERSYEETVALKTARDFLIVHANLGDKIAQETKATLDTLRVYQERTRTIQSEITLLNAVNSANSKIYAMGGAGRAAQIRDEESVRALQVEQLQIQINVHKTLIGIATSQLELIENERNLNKERESGLLLQLELAESMTQARLAAKASDLNVAGPAINNSTGKMAITGISPALVEDAKNYNTIQDSIEITQKRITESEQNYTKAKEAQVRIIRDHQDSINSLNNQIAAINQQNLTQEQKIQQIKEAQTALYKESLSLIESTLQKSSELANIDREIYGIVNNVTGRLDYQLLVLTKSSNIQKEQTKRAYEDAQRAFKAAKEQAAAEKSRAGSNTDLLAAVDSAVQAQENNLAILTEQYNIDIKLIDAKQRQAVLEKVIFDTRSQGLEWQKTVLDMSMKQLDAERDLALEVNKTFRLRQSIAAKRGGYEITAQGNSADEIRVAKINLDSALRESEIKKSLIDLEFALLAAQRDNLELELKTRRDRLTSENKNGEFNAQISQLDTTLKNLPSGQTILQGAELQKQAVDASIVNMRLALEEALAIGIKGPLSQQTGALQGLADYFKARTTAKTPEASPIAVAKTYIDNTAQKTADQISKELDTTGRISELSSNTVALKSLRETIIAWIEKNPTQTVNANNVLNSNMSLRNAYDHAKSQGFIPSELLGVGAGVQKKHSATGGHYTGKSFDVNIGSGNTEWNNPEQKAKMDELANFYRQQGFRVLWGVKDHFDHMDVSITGTARKSMDSIVTNTEKVATEASNKIDTIQQNTSINSNMPITVANKSAPFVGVANDNPVNTSGMPLLGDLGIPQVKTSSVFKDMRDDIIAVTEATKFMDEGLRALGPEGETVLAIRDGLTSISTSALNMADTFNKASSTADKVQAVAEVASAVIGTIQQITSASSQAKIAAIDKEIAAEQKRDGKSAESLAKMQALEKKKDEIARKQFNTNKKLMMAQAIIATAAGITQALALPPPMSFILAGVIGAMGAAQLAIIAGTQYQSTASSVGGVPAVPSLSVGKRGDTVDLAKQNTNTGGELGYLRGAQGQGRNSSNYQIVGSAYGGDLPRGYGNTAYVVGEKGPETIIPNTPMSVRPANDSASSNVNATFNIKALDSSGVEDLLHRQKGNIISLIRDAANANGSPFLEDIDVNVYSRPNSASRL